MANRFDIWLATSRAGSEFIYHTGPTLSKNGEGLDFSDLVYSAREAFERGEVMLVQKRLSWGKRRAIDIGRFAWVAIKREKVKKPDEWISLEGHVVDWVQRPERRRKKSNRA